MLSKDQSGRLRFWRVALVLPVIAAVAVFVSCQKDAAAPAAQKGLYTTALAKITLDSVDVVKLKLKKMQEGRLRIMTPDGKEVYKLGPVITDDQLDAVKVRAMKLDYEKQLLNKDK